MGKEDQVPKQWECLINSPSWQIGPGPVLPYGPVLMAQYEPLHAAQFLLNQGDMIHFVSSLLRQHLGLAICSVCMRDRERHSHIHTTVCTSIILSDQA